MKKITILLLLLSFTTSYAQNTKVKPMSGNYVESNEITRKKAENRKKMDFLKNKEINPGIQKFMDELTPIYDRFKKKLSNAESALNELRTFKVRWNVFRPKFVALDKEYIKLETERNELWGTKFENYPWGYHRVDSNIEQYEKTILWQIAQNKSQKK